MGPGALDLARRPGAHRPDLGPRPERRDQRWGRWLLARRRLQLARRRRTPLGRGPSGREQPRPARPWAGAQAPRCDRPGPPGPCSPASATVGWPLGPGQRRRTAGRDLRPAGAPGPPPGPVRHRGWPASARPGTPDRAGRRALRRRAAPGQPRPAHTGPSRARPGRQPPAPVARSPGSHRRRRQLPQRRPHHQRQRHCRALSRNRAAPAGHPVRAAAGWRG